MGSVAEELYCPYNNGLPRCCELRSANNLQIAHELDAEERALMLSSGADGADYQRFLQEESGNVAADGMFSIQVRRLSYPVWPFLSTSALLTPGEG